MIFFKRKRLIYWLLKAYLKRSGKTILISFLIGLVAFFVLKYGVNYFIPLLPFVNEEKIGLEGAYTVDNLPLEIISKISMGLTALDKNYNVIPSVAKKWEIKDDGKTYIFYLNDNIFFSDNTKLTAEDIGYNFKDATTQIPNKSTIIFRLKSKYSPFLVTVSRPIFKNDFIGIGSYKVQSIDLNGSFVQSITLRSIKEQNKVLTYQFYPTQEALKTAFVLGEVNKIIRISDTGFKDTNLDKFPNVVIEKYFDDLQLITLFYNTSDKDLSDKRLREAMSYAIPDDFTHGKRNFGPFSPNSWVSQQSSITNSQDLEHAKILLEQSDSFKNNKNLVFEIKTFPKYLEIAKKIQSEFAKAGIKTKITVTDSLPITFQLFLGDFKVPKDPDQYMLWHSLESDNISRYKNLRIDKLLEDGRQTADLNQRKKIYADFQKYLLDDPPASFIIFPHLYDVSRR